MIRPKLKYCHGCKQHQVFRTRIVNEKRYLRTVCNKCENKKRYERMKKCGLTKSRIAIYKRYQQKMSYQRSNNIDRARWIMVDSKQIATKKGLNHTLNKKMVERIIASGCKYCGEKKLKMTLDRINNSLGYTKNNIHCACIRCNYARRDMPYRAWLCLIRGMKTARLKNLFGDWTGSCISKRGVAQLVERLHGVQEVAGAEPVIPTEL